MSFDTNTPALLTQTSNCPNFAVATSKKIVIVDEIIKNQTLDEF